MVKPKKKRHGDVVQVAKSVFEEFIKISEEKSSQKTLKIKKKG
jgi:hypothetical protein